MELGYEIKGFKKLKRGYTTGTCATAASKAATYMLLNKEILDDITVTLPSGDQITLDIGDVTIKDNYASCSVVKDGGDDPDITTGTKIYSKVEINPNSNDIELYGGQGVGRVTRTGLPAKVGEPAINPVPRQMILSEVNKVREGKGVRVTISIPEGKRLAKKTLNPVIGIEGGISILGTTGIVNPMSEDAYKKSIEMELKALKEEGGEVLVITPGNYGEYFLKEKYKLEGVPIIRVSNFIGFALEASSLCGFKKVVLVGDIGKFIKVAGGVFDTHSRVADARMEIMAAYASLLGGSRKLVQQILECNTTVAAMELIDKENIDGYYDYVASKISERAHRYVYDEMDIGVILFSNQKGILSEDKKAYELLKGERYE